MVSIAGNVKYSVPTPAPAPAPRPVKAGASEASGSAPRSAEAGVGEAPAPALAPTATIRRSLPGGLTINGYGATAQATGGKGGKSKGGNQTLENAGGDMIKTSPESSVSPSPVPRTRRRRASP